jgi:FlaA1/EpsC-like NDP-sugar epimerase
MDILKLIGRTAPLFESDISTVSKELEELVSSSRFLVIGGAGSIGQAVTREIFKRNPLTLHVVDISENNMVELVRDIRSTLGYINGDFRTFAIDCGSNEYMALMNAGKGYDYVLNLSALKHVRSEKDPFTLMRLIEVNILNTIKTVQIAKAQGAKKYFCVSTDKAANPVNMMGASKRIMEMFLMSESETIKISTARFANVRRYFVTPQESGELCLMSCLLGENRDIFFPKLSEQLHLTTFSSIAERYIKNLGYEPYHCSTEQEARDRTDELIASKRWPCYFFKSDTSGEKDFEEFFTENEALDMYRFKNLGVIKNQPKYNIESLDNFLEVIVELRAQKTWEKEQVVDLFNQMIPGFDHKETGKYLDGRM